MLIRHKFWFLFWQLKKKLSGKSDVRLVLQVKEGKSTMQFETNVEG